MFKEDDTVEVLRRRTDPCGSWFPGKIISVDGENYTVRYELVLDCERKKPLVEKVDVQDVRPQPPPAKGERWMRGDIAEVFDDHSWRAGKVAKVLKNNQFVIKLSGSIQLKEFHKSSLRIRQTWNNNTWSMIGKVGLNKQMEKNLTQTSLKYSRGQGCGAPRKGTCKESRTTMRTGKDNFKRDVQENFNMFPPARTLKRDWDCCLKSSPNNTVIAAGGGKRRNGTIKVEGSDRLPMRTLPFELDSKTEKANSYFSRPSLMPVRNNEANNECSASSCSSNDLAECIAPNSQKLSRFIADGSSDDAGSSCLSVSRRQKLLLSCSSEEIEANIHELELHAYRSTVQALFASGPLSWERESLLTNLRISLHISNEEHRLELRHLLSVQVL